MLIGSVARVVGSPPSAPMALWLEAAIVHARIKQEQ